MLGSTEDAEDVLQEVFTASYNAMIADERPINARPWLYRIARNRCLNHLRRPTSAGQDSMDIFENDGGATTADTVHKREEFRQIVADVQDLPETQRTALLLREIDALSYDQIAEAMDTTVPSVKSLLVRARVSLAEAAEARLLTCEEVRLELGQVAEGLARTTAPVRRHLRTCERCRTFRVELRKTTRALAAVYPLGPLIFFKKLWLAKAGFGGAGAAAGGGGVAAGSGGMAGVAMTAAGGFTAGGAVSAGVSTLASKAAAGVAAAVIVTAGAVEVRHVSERQVAPPAQVAVAPSPAPAPTAPPAPPAEVKATEHRAEAPAPAPAEVEPVVPVAPAPAPVDVVEEPPAPPVQEEGSTVTVPPRDEDPTEPATPPGEPAEPGTQPAEPGSDTGETPPPAPPAGEPGGTSDPLPPPPPPAP